MKLSEIVKRCNELRLEFGDIDSDIIRLDTVLSGEGVSVSAATIKGKEVIDKSYYILIAKNIGCFVSKTVKLNDKVPKQLRKIALRMCDRNTLKNIGVWSEKEIVAYIETKIVDLRRLSTQEVLEHIASRLNEMTDSSYYTSVVIKQMTKNQLQFEIEQVRNTWKRTLSNVNN